jgi:hypothetical protein
LGLAVEFTACSVDGVDPKRSARCLSGRVKILLVTCRRIMRSASRPGIPQAAHGLPLTNRLVRKVIPASGLQRRQGGSAHRMIRA